ncbi:MAG: flavodoxin family protein [Thermodesulfobacteriota bacterium]
MSGQGQVFLDRTFSLWHQRKLRNRAGGCVVVSNRRGGLSAIRVINGALFSHHVIVAGYSSGYGYAPGDVRNDERALSEAIALGKRLCELIRIPRRDIAYYLGTVWSVFGQARWHISRFEVWNYLILKPHISTHLF